MLSLSRSNKELIYFQECSVGGIIKVLRTGGDSRMLQFLQRSATQQLQKCFQMGSSLLGCQVFRLLRIGEGRDLSR